MNYYYSARKQREEAKRCFTNVLQCLADKRDSAVHFRLPKWMREQIKVSGKSEADFIIAKLGMTMFKPYAQNDEDWQNELKEIF